MAKQKKSETEVKTKTCICGKQFTVERKWQNYCSAACSQKAYRERKASEKDQLRELAEANGIVGFTQETHENYGKVVVKLSESRRIIASVCDLQWIVQSIMPSGTWRNEAYCGTKEGLILRVGNIDEIAALPEYFPKNNYVWKEIASA